MMRFFSRVQRQGFLSGNSRNQFPDPGLRRHPGAYGFPLLSGKASGMHREAFLFRPASMGGNVPPLSRSLLPEGCFLLGPSKNAGT